MLPNNVIDDAVSHVTSTTSSTTKSKTTWQKIYTSVGFERGYNLPLFIIFAGAMFGFSLARLSYLNISGNASSSYKSGSAPGEYYWVNQVSTYRIGLALHLASIIPAGLLMVWQFVPLIRHKLLVFHRINGYIIITLVLLGNVGALMIARRAFGGTLATQSVVGILVIITTLSMAMAYYNIKRLQIDQHRAWMLRAMFYLGVIITTRLIMIISALVTTKLGTFYTVRPCGQIASIYGGHTAAISSRYPSCNATNPEHLVVVQADLNGGPEEIGVALGMSFGMALWLSLVLHAVGVEIYLALTPRESNRLRQVSYERQLERGFENPGSAGLVVERWGDADEWVPRSVEVKEGL